MVGKVRRTGFSYGVAPDTAMRAVRGLAAANETSSAPASEYFLSSATLAPALPPTTGPRRAGSWSGAERQMKQMAAEIERGFQERMQESSSGQGARDEKGGAEMLRQLSAAARRAAAAARHEQEQERQRAAQLEDQLEAVEHQLNNAGAQQAMGLREPEPMPELTAEEWARWKTTRDPGRPQSSSSKELLTRQALASAQRTDVTRKEILAEYQRRVTAEREMKQAKTELIRMQAELGAHLITFSDFQQKM